jgi:hypothetical protein
MTRLRLLLRELFFVLKLALMLACCLLQVNLSTTAFAATPISSTPTPQPASSNQQAADADRTFRETNDVLYYDCSGGAAGSAGASTASGDSGGCGTNASDDATNEKQTFDYLTQQFESKGFSSTDAQNAAAGVMGNWQQESGLNSYISGGQGCGKNSPAVGIAQWCGSRATNLQNFAASQGKPVDCLGTQLAFAWSELDGGYGNVIQDMKGKSASQDAQIFDTEFEKSTDQQNGNNNRENYASALYSSLTGQSSTVGNAGATPVSATTPGSGTVGSAGSTGSSSCAQGGAAAAPDDGSCKNPFRDLQGSGVSRIDGGYDYGGPNGSGPIYAACPATIVIVESDGAAGWPGNGSFIEYQMTSGKAKNLFIYIAEDCAAVVKVGDQVDTSKPICNYKDQGTELETGWGDGKDTGYVQWSDYPQHDNNWASNSGVDIDKFLQTLGLPHDNVNEGPDTGSPPADWPKWTT